MSTHWIHPRVRAERMHQLVDLLKNTHTFWTAKGAESMLRPFGIDPETVLQTYTDTSDQFKGLSIDGCEPGDTATGCESEGVAQAIAHKLSVDTSKAYEYSGRGTRTRYIVHCIIDEVMKPGWVKAAEAAGYIVSLGMLDDPEFPTQGIWSEADKHDFRSGASPVTLSDSGPDVRPFHGANAWVVIHPDEKGNGEFPESWTDEDVEAKKAS